MTPPSAVFAKKKNLRLILTGDLPDPARGGIALRTIAGGALLQSRDNGRITRDDLKVVTKRAPDRAGADRLPVRLDRGASTSSRTRSSMPRTAPLPGSVQAR
jgi:AICAR transformylase/IMP cyclohydrolase PurH